MSRHIVISTFALYDLTLWFWAGRGQCISILLYDILIHNAFFLYIYISRKQSLEGDIGISMFVCL